MSEYYYVACLECKEMVSVLKLSEPSLQKCSKLFKFLEEHLLHNLRVVGDEFNYDDEVIRKNEIGEWETDYDLFKKEWGSVNENEW